VASNVLPLRRFPILGWDQISAPLPDIPWLNAGLNMAPGGRPFVFCGEAGTKKSWFAQTLLVTVAADIPMLGRFAWRRGGARGLFIDYEQGERESRLRFQAIAGGLQLSASKLAGQIAYAWQPIERWNPDEKIRKRVVDDVCALVDGFDLAVVDSLLDCQPGAEENTSEISAALKLATSASEKCGCTFVFVDHASGKSSGERRNAQRGHSSKKGASSVLLVASGLSPDPVTVTCERSQNAPYDLWPASFAYDLKRAAGGILLEEIALPNAAKPPADVQLETMAEAMRSMVEANEGASFDEIRKLMGVRAEDLRAARDKLVRTGRIENRGSGSRPSWYLRTSTEPPAESGDVPF
jgi:RecA-family ATPase